MAKRKLFGAALKAHLKKIGHKVRRRAISAAKSYVANPGKPPRRRRRAVVRVVSRRRSYRRNPEFSIMEAGKMGLAATGGAIIIPFVLNKIPFLPAQWRSEITAAVSLLAAALLWKKNHLAASACVGGFAVGAANAIKNRVPMLAGDEPTQNEMAALMGAVADEEAEAQYALNGPLSGPLNGPLYGDDSELLGSIVQEENSFTNSAFA